MCLSLFTIPIGIFFEMLMMLYHPKKDWYESSYNQFISLINAEYELISVFEKFDSYQKMNQAIFALIIISIIFLFITFILYIVLSCMNEHKNGLIKALLVFILLFNIANLIMSFLIAVKVSKIEKKVSELEGFDYISDIKKGIIKVLLLSLAKIALCIFQLYCYHCEGSNCRDCSCCSKDSSSDSNSYPRHTITNNDNNYQSSTNRGIIVVSTRQYKLRLKEVVSYNIYANLDSYIRQGKKILEELISFYIEMDFIGYNTKESIINEITNIITELAVFLKNRGDRIINICLDSNDEDAMYLLLFYLFPFIIHIIKLKIQKGIYKRVNYVVVTNQVRILTQLERRVERDIDGNIRETFRFTQQVTQDSLNNLLK